MGRLNIIARMQTVKTYARSFLRRNLALCIYCRCKIGFLTAAYLSCDTPTVMNIDADKLMNSNGYKNFGIRIIWILVSKWNCLLNVSSASQRRYMISHENNVISNELKVLWRVEVLVIKWKMAMKLNTIPGMAKKQTPTPPIQYSKSSINSWSSSSNFGHVLPDDIFELMPSINIKSLSLKIVGDALIIMRMKLFSKTSELVRWLEGKLLSGYSFNITSIYFKFFFNYISISILLPIFQLHIEPYYKDKKSKHIQMM